MEIDSMTDDGCMALSSKPPDGNRMKMKRSSQFQSIKEIIILLRQIIPESMQALKEFMLRSR